jgi:putative hydrolase of the HAD superfamily
MRAILFDRGETLVHFGETDYEAGQRVILSSVRPPHALDRDAFDRFEDEFFEKIEFYRQHANLECNLLHYYELLSRYFGVQFDKSHEELCRQYHLVAENISPLPGAQKVLAALKSAGFLLGLVTNTSVPHSVIKDELDRLALYDYFDTVVCSSEIVFRKPDRAMFDVALRSLNVSPTEAMFVGDDYRADIVGAKNVGLKTVWLNPERQPILGEVKPDYNIAELEEILEFAEIIRKA